MFSYLHDVMHVEGYWMEKNRWLRRWFTSARNLHDIHHHVVNRDGLMDKNFGICFRLRSAVQNLDRTTTSLDFVGMRSSRVERSTMVGSRNPVTGGAVS